MISKAPARICLFGDHQDYLGLPVIACAINKYMVVEGVPNNTKYLLFSLIDFDQVIKINLDEDFSVLKKGDHIRYVIKTLKKNNIKMSSSALFLLRVQIFGRKKSKLTRKLRYSTVRYDAFVCRSNFSDGIEKAAPNHSNHRRAPNDQLSEANGNGNCSIVYSNFPQLGVKSDLLPIHCSCHLVPNEQ